MKKIFIDSDILLDALLKRPQFVLDAVNVLVLADNTAEFQLMTSAVAFVNVHYFLDKYDHINKFQRLKGLRLKISIINVDEKIIDQALKSGNDDFEDMVQYFAAISADVDVILTRNKKDYKQSILPVLTAGEFLNTLN